MPNSHALIIDDNAQNIGVLATLLKFEDVDATKVQMPKTLHAMIDDMQQPNVVFLDLEMPGMDGFEVLDMLKAHDRFQNTPIVAYTVHVSEINVARDYGFDGFLGKPLDADKFSGQLQRILDGESVWVTP